MLPGICQGRCASCSSSWRKVSLRGTAFYRPILEVAENYKKPVSASLQNWIFLYFTRDEQRFVCGPFQEACSRHKSVCLVLGTGMDPEQKRSG